MYRLILCLAAVPLAAEVRTFTLGQAVDLAVRQNPEIAMARLEEASAQQAVRQARDPFTPRIVVGSGLAATYGFPMSIEGAAPSLVQAQATQYLFNRRQSYAVAQARESARGASIGVAARRDEVAWRTASLFLEAERAGRIRTLALKELESLRKVEQSVQAAVGEGRELALAARRAAYNVARARQAIEALEADQASAETSLAIALGLGVEDRARPAGEDRAAPPLPASEDGAIGAALESSQELRRLESQVAVKELEIRGERAARLPRIDLVAQYGLFAKFNNYEDYFRRFERHNGQLGVSFQLPVLAGPGVEAAVSIRRTDISRLRLEMAATRNRITLDLRNAWSGIRKAETAREVARLDLEVAREQLSVNLALIEEGRLTLRQVEEARVAESDKWIALYDAEYAVERARLGLLRHTGELVAHLSPGGRRP